MGNKKSEKTQTTPTTDESTAAFDMTTEEAVAKKEIHIVGQRVKYFREKRGMEQDGSCRDARREVKCYQQLGARKNAA